MSNNLDELKTKLEGMGGGKKPAAKTEKLKSEKKSVRGKNGGARPGAGRKPNEINIALRGIKAQIDEYSKGDVEIEVQDPKTGLKRKVKKPRVLWAMETFFTFGMEMAAKKDSAGIQALDKFLDRALGKAAQPIRGEGEDDAPIKIGVDITSILAKAYGHNSPKED